MPARGTRQAGGGNGKRKTDYENTALPQAVAVGGHGAAVKTHDVLDDREPEPHPAITTVRAASLPEAIENVLESALVDSLPVVGDDNFDVRIDSLEPHLHLAVLGRVLDRVGQEIPHRLLQPLRIAHNKVGARIEYHLYRD